MCGFAKIVVRVIAGTVNHAGKAHAALALHNGSDSTMRHFTNNLMNIGQFGFDGLNQNITKPAIQLVTLRNMKGGDSLTPKIKGADSSSS
jgi:hypothetical protein